MSKPPQLKVSTEWVSVEVISEADVFPTFRGYAPVLHVRIEDTTNESILYISAVSLCERLEELRKQNGGRFTGLRFGVRKESEEHYAKYEVRETKDGVREIELLKRTRDLSAD